MNVVYERWGSGAEHARDGLLGQWHRTLDTLIIYLVSVLLLIIIYRSLPLSAFTSAWTG
jgi:hypothetical protein